MIDWGRSSKIRAMAQRQGLSYLGDALPRSLSLLGTRVEAISKTWNVIDGTQKNIQVIAVDCRIGQGKSSWRRTVIAAQSSHNPFPATSFDKDLTVERSVDWAILYRWSAPSFLGAGLMPVAELEAHLSAIG